MRMAMLRIGRRMPGSLQIEVQCRDRVLRNLLSALTRCHRSRMSVQSESGVSLDIEERRGYRALVVEDDDGIVSLVRRVLEREQFTVECVRTGGAAIELMKTVAYDLLIIDLMLPFVSGEEVMTFIEETQPHPLRGVIV